MQSERFDIRRSLGAGGMGVVYEALDRESQRLVALKTLHEVSPQSVYRLKQEFRALADIRHPGLLKLDELHFEDGHWFFTMELVDGVPFQDWVSDWGPESTVENTLDTATIADAVPSAPVRHAQFDETRLRAATAELVRALCHLHGLERLHCDVKSSNVHVTADGRVVLLDFGLTRGFGGTPGATAGRLEGTISAMAPEQATEGELTPAADFYAVGVLLYHALTGAMPYIGAPAQVLAEKQRHAPIPPTERVSGVPQDLDQLTVALLDPDPLQRPDAEAILAVLATGMPADLEIQPGAREAFFGRAEELSHLAAVHDRGASELAAVLVRGPAGQGKTALVQQFLIGLDGVAVLRSRCHEQEAVPLNALDGVIDALSHHLMGLTPVDAALVLPLDLAPLVGLFPVLERVPVVAHAVRDGAYHPMDFVGAANALHGILTALSRRVRLVIFIDDLQWMDQASVQFLSTLQEAGSWPGTVICTARPTTPDRDPLQRIGQRSPELAGRFEVLELGGLTPGDSQALLRDGWSALGDDGLRALSEEAEGHPLLLKELARYLTMGGDSARPIHLVDALQHRIGQLGDREETVLEAVCISRAGLDLDLLVAVTDLPRVECALAAQSLKGGQLIRVVGPAGERVLEPYHDRIRETIEALQPDHSTLHTRLGHALAQRLADSDATLFAAAIHYGLGSVETGERVDAARVVVRAAEAAQWVNAQDRCLEFVAVASRILADADAELRQELDLIELEAIYRTGDFDGGEAHFERLRAAATDPIHLADVFGRSAKMLLGIGRDDLAAERMLVGLSDVGMPMSASPGRIGVLLGFATMSWKLRGLDAEALGNLPICTDPDKIAFQRMGQHYGMHAYRGSPDLLALLIMRSMPKLVEDGLSRHGALMICGYAMVIGGTQGRWDETRKLVDATLEVIERTGCDGVDRAWVHTSLGGFPMAMVRPWPEVIALLVGSLPESRTNSSTSVGLRLILMHQYAHSGVDQRLTRDAAKALLREGSRLNMEDWLHAGKLELWMAQVYLAEIDGSDLAELDPADEPHLQIANFGYGHTLFRYHIHFGDVREAWRGAQRAREQWEAVFCSPAWVMICFAEVVSASRLLPVASWTETPALKWAIRRGLSKLEEFVGACPENFATRQAVAIAETSPTDANIERAIDIARAHDDNHMLAWSLEMAGRLDEAADAWESYGAIRKARLLRRPA